MKVDGKQRFFRALKGERKCECEYYIIELNCPELYGMYYTHKQTLLYYTTVTFRSLLTCFTGNQTQKETLTHSLTYTQKHHAERTDGAVGVGRIKARETQ